MGRMLLIVVDSRSKCIKVLAMTIPTAAKTEEVLGRLFAQFGLPEQIVLDNGPQFISEKLRVFHISSNKWN